MRKALSATSAEEMEPKGLKQTIPGKTEDHQKFWSRDIAVKELSGMVFSTEKHVDCLFFKVPEPIRRGRSECYEPQVIALGLYGRSNTQCSMMENVKLELASAVLKVLLNSTELAKTEVHSRVSGGEEKVVAIWNHLCDQLVHPGNEGVDIWKQYSDAPQELTFRDVQHQLTLDAMFLVSFLLFQHADPKTKSFGIPAFKKYEILLEIFTRAEILCNIYAINSDIWLFENQIPLLLIRRMVRAMYLDEGNKESSDQKKEAAEQAFGILIKETFQKALRVLPGNYTTRSRSKTKCVTDRMLQSTSLKKCSHLLECLYKLVCSWDDKVDNEETEGDNNPNDVDSSHKFHPRTEEGVRKGFDRWTNMRSPVHSSESSKGKSREEVEMQEEGSVNSGTRTSSRSMNRQESQLQQSSSGGSGRVIDEESTPKPSEVRRRTSLREKHQKEFGSDNEPAIVEDEGVLLRLPPVQEIEGALEQSENSSASPTEQDHQQVVERERRASRRPSKSVLKTEPHPSSEQTSTTVSTHIENGPPAAEASKREEELRPRVCCVHSSRVTSMCCGHRETAIDIDPYILPTATELREVGIRVKGDTSPGCHCKVELTYSYLPWPWGSVTLGATLHISPLHVDGTAETLLRNLVVQEKVSTDKIKLITYLQCLDDLIDTASDVSLLKKGRHPVILNSSLDGNHVATMVNKLLDGSRMYYNSELEAIRKKVRLYNLQQWRRPLTEIKERYLNHKRPWLAISLIAAFWLVILTLVQTIYTVLGFYTKP